MFKNFLKNFWKLSTETKERNRIKYKKIVNSHKNNNHLRLVMKQKLENEEL